MVAWLPRSKKEDFGQIDLGNNKKGVSIKSKNNGKIATIC